MNVALALGCERVICVTGAQEPEMPVLRDAAEAAGASFHPVPGVRGMLGLVSVADEVIAFAEGLLVWPDAILPLLEGGPCVLAQPVDRGLEYGFERLDLHHAAAGAFRVPGRLIERLAPLPDDADPFSILQRVGLQSGVPQVQLPAEALEGGRWQLVRREEDAHRAEAAWFRMHTSDGGAVGPSEGLALHAVRALGPALLHAGSGAAVVALAGLVLAGLALVSGWFAFSTVALLCAAVAWVLFLGASLFRRVERRSPPAPRPPSAALRTYGWVFDGLLALVLIWNETARVGQGWQHRAFAPLVLLGLMRLVPRLLSGKRAAWMEDRAIIAVLLAAGSLAGWMDEAILVLVAAYLAAGLQAVRGPLQLTPL
ncbi:MAG: hypothetical protein KGJ57_11120 [Sphingomonadales bacterium]|nr:hypothetical protein [Sphingomonadales bacterium]MDE2169965.1 hypothetical protein [Sphingomonadales bacterium]